MSRVPTFLVFAVLVSFVAKAGPADENSHRSFESNTIHTMTYEPVVRPAAPPESNPDDVYWDNSISPSLPGMNGSVLALMAFEDRLIAGGGFSIAGGTDAKRVAAWDGTTWSTLGEGIDGSVRAMTIYGGKLIVGGRFTTAGGTEANSIAAWDGTSWSTLGEGVDGGVSALTIYGDKLIAGGFFDTAGGTEANNIAAWDGTSWSTLGEGIDGSVAALTIYDDELIAGGAFTEAGDAPNHIAAWDGTSWSGLGAGIEGGNPYRPPSVTALAVYDNRLIAGGEFTTAGGLTANNIAAWDGISWSPLGSGILDRCFCIVRIFSLTVSDDKLIAGGDFSGVSGTEAINIAAWDGGSWSAIGAGINSPVQALGVYRNELVAGFSDISRDEYCGECSLEVTRGDHIAVWNGASWSALGMGVGAGGGSWVSALTVYDNTLIAGGRFTSAGDKAANYIAAWDGTSWFTLGMGMRGRVTALTVYDNKLIAGGAFKGAGDSHANYIAAWDGGSWSPLGEGVGGTVLALTTYGDRLIAGGFFDTAGGTEAKYVAAWDGTSWSRLGVGMSNPVDALTVYGDRLIAGGAFTVAGDSPANHAATWDGTSWSALASGTNGRIRAFTVHDNELIAGGDFTEAGGSPANHIAAWDGANWTGLGSGTNGSVSVLTTLDGNVVVGGSFTMAGSDVSNLLAEWTKRLEQRVALDIRPGSCPNPINGNSTRGRGKAVLPVAILGTAEVDVHDIDANSITLSGASPVRWNYKDVGAPPEDPGNDCACSTSGPDGIDDLTLKFYSADVVASLGGSGVVSAEGKFIDGTSFVAEDCVTLVGQSALKSGATDETKKHVVLSGNIPNPFNPGTRITFYLPAAAEVKLEIYDVLGQHVVTLIDQRLEAGDQSVTWDGRRAASGIYYCRLTAGDVLLTRKMLLLK